MIRDLIQYLTVRVLYAMEPWTNVSDVFSDLNTLNKVRDQIPTGKQKRYDLYDVTAKL